MSVTLHTTLGDIKIEVFCESVPRAAEVCTDLHLLPLLCIYRYLGLARQVNKLPPELPRPLCIALLRLVTLPPPHPRLHGANRRPSKPNPRKPQRWPVHLGRRIRGRDPAGAEAHGERHGLDGE